MSRFELSPSQVEFHMRELTEYEQKVLIHERARTSERAWSGHIGGQESRRFRGCRTAHG